MWHQTQLQLKPFTRGFHLITDNIIRALPELKELSVGLVHIQLLHTSASITLNENADPSVRADFESFFTQYVRENEPYYQHTLEGSDDMPAHLKSSLLGSTLTLAISNGYLALGTWQGIYLGEHRNHASGRQIMLTLQGK